MAALPPVMGDLLDYFEARNHSLDKVDVSHSLCLDSKFTSCITFNGIPILPPVMTQRRREEMAGYRRQALQRETRRRSKQREQLVAKVQSIVAEVEKEFSLKCRTRLPRTANISRLLEKRARGHSDSTGSSPVGSDSTASSKVSPGLNYRHSPTEPPRTDAGLQDQSTGQGVSVSTKKELTESQRSQVSKKDEETNKPSQKSEGKQNSCGHSEKQKVASKGTTKPGKGTTEPAKLKGDSKCAQVSSKAKQSQIPKPVQIQNQNKILSNLKRASSMSSLPNLAKIEGLPTPKPPTSPKTKNQLRRARLGMSGQFSISQPDLRDIDNSDSETSMSSHSQVEENTIQTKHKLLMSVQHSVSNPDLVSAGLSPDRSPSAQEQKGKLSPSKKLTSSTSVPNLTSVGRPKKKKFRDTEEAAAQKAKQNLHKSDQDAKPKASLIPVSMPPNIDLENKEERLDALSDFTSLENCNSLPHEFAGMPLSSIRQQQISHVLAKLSQCLNIQDTISTLNSTESSGNDTAEIRQQVTDQILASAGIKPGSVQAQQFLNQYNIEQAASENVPDESFLSNIQTPPSNNSSAFSSEPFSSSSGGNRTQTSIASNSIMSSGGSASGGQQQSRRMSPKGGKSKVHFSSFLTEISTSASQSLEGRISVRKMDITPQSSPRVSVDTVDGLQTINSQENLKLRIVPKNSNDLGLGSGPQVICDKNSEETESMLSRVALSPETSESSPGTPKDIFSIGLPFHGYGNEPEHNSSDKENDFKGKFVGTSEGFIQTTVSSPFHIDTRDCVKESVRSDDGSQCSTLKASQDLLRSRESGVGNCKSSVLDVKSEIQLATSEKNSEGIDSNQTGQQQQTVSSCDNVSFQHSLITQNKINPVETTYRMQTQRIQSKAEAKRAIQNPHPLQHTSPAVVPAESHEFVSSGAMHKGPASCSAQRKLDLNVEMNMGYTGLHAQNISMDTSTEQEGKAEHIQKYLSQVQSQRGDSPVNTGILLDMPPLGTAADITAAIQSFTASLQSLENMSEEELLQIQAEHFNKIRQFLIEQQRQQLEELFVIQRREQLDLQNEITSYQNNARKQAEFSNTSYLSNSVHLYQPNLQLSSENNAAYHADQPFNTSHISHYGNTAGVDNCHHTQPKQFAYVSSPSLYVNPKNRDNNSDISTFSRATPKQSLQFVNYSTPSPKTFKPVVHSPVKQPSYSGHSKTVRILNRAYDDEMQSCFDHVSACVKGYLTRRLLKTEKVQEIIKTIQDTKQFACSFQSETPIKRGMFSHQDSDLLDRIIAQLQAALLDIHDIFFEIPVHERMALITQSRQLMKEKQLRGSTTVRTSDSTSQPRISSATLKVIERKRKANEAEVAGNLRPQSAPTETSLSRQSTVLPNNHFIDFSEPMRRHFQSLLSRALKPIQDQSTALNPARETTKPQLGVVLSKPVSLTVSKTKKPMALGGVGERERESYINYFLVAGKSITAKSFTSNTKTKATIKPKFIKPASAWR
ncbi:uncharacterized protein LOC125670995 isoform X2 [Ostrea edulis]|uniref:uncharacterized protein LOC125670995 isoform X2 n=2 Tax=Ostrea edulis TaxID=37623 RepID=UPI0024AEE071|nr:uncharacterized protein LOC125670995 isoform X2 [Ostrea edulis]XP_056018757.1 uncharacterized protein LOC125670995 isoform X2 [Ostrea edulis]